MILSHLSFWVLLACVACILFSWRPVWAHLLFLQLLCLAIVFFSASCRDSTKYAWAAVKLLLLVLACVRCRRFATGPRYILAGTLIAATYVSLVDVSSVYGCAPTNKEYAIAYVTSLLAYVATTAVVISGGLKLLYFA